MSGPLEGVRIVDLTSVALGPYASMTLGDWGADVVKVEPPEGDIVRQAGPARTPNMGALFLTLGRNKRSAALDLARPGARQALLHLAATADVFMHNLRAPAVRKLGIGYAEVAAANPGIVYCTARGFGADGPYADRPAYDDVIQALCGVVSLQERLVGQPAYLPTIVADKTVGLVTANAVLAALVHRERTGRGQEVTVPMLEVMAGWVLVEHQFGAVFDPAVGPPGYPRVLSPLRKPYRTADGYICALPYQDKHYAALFERLDRPDLAADERFGSLGARLAHIDHVYGTLEALLATRTTEEWLKLFEETHIPAVPVNTIDTLLDDRHLRAVGFFQTVDHPTEGTLVQPGVAVEFAATPGSLRRPAPRLGEHTVEVLEEAGWPPERIGALVAEGAAVDGR